MVKPKVIDPGHGYPDPGAVGADGAHEADITLAVGKIVRDGLKRSGYPTVIMTREVDRLPMGAEATIAADLHFRADMANKAGADLYVSLHCDSANEYAHGITTFVHPHAGPSTRAKAARVHAALIAATGLTDRGVRDDDLAVLRDTEMDAMLIEMGFISNPTERELLESAKYQNIVGTTVARTICEIDGIAYVTDTPAPSPIPTTAPEYTLQEDAVNNVIAYLGGMYQADGHLKNACNWAANALRTKMGWAIPPGALPAPSKEAAQELIDELGERWMSYPGTAIQVALHYAADELRKLL